MSDTTAHVTYYISTKCKNQNMLVVKVPIFVILFLMAGFAQGFMQSVKNNNNKEKKRIYACFFFFYNYSIVHHRTLLADQR